MQKRGEVMPDKIKINPRIGWRMIGNEIVTFNCENQQIAIWNETASQLWQMLSNEKDANQMISYLNNEYRVDQQQAKKDTLNFLQEAAGMGFINAESTNPNLAIHDIDDGENVLLTIEMKAIKHFIPFAVTFETTYSCNERCIHCYMERNLPSLKLHEIKSILEQIAQEGCLFVSFTGGEFFTRPDALKIVEYASKLHFSIDILSNGTLINQEIAETLTANPVRRIQISLYGANSEIHDSITRLRGSFLKTVQAIEILKETGIKVEIAFPMMRHNFKERYAVKQLAESMDCVISPSPIITARNDGSKDTHSLRLTNGQMVQFLEDKDFSGLYAGRKPFQDHQFYLGISNLLEATPCYSGFNTCAITPSGKVLPCNQLLYEVGDLRKTEFSEIWYNSSGLRYLRGLKIKDIKKCSVCENLTYCARCPGLAFLEGGDLLGRSPENCRITKTIKRLY